MGVALVHAEQPADALIHIRRGINELNIGGGGFVYPEVNLAEVELALGRVRDAADIARVAIERMRRDGELWYLPEAFRFRGKARLAEGEIAGAEVDFREAVDVARSQAAKSFELRAATDLARLWHSQAKTDEAAQLLSQVYDVFTEGFETGDLVDANELLEEMGGKMRSKTLSENAHYIHGDEPNHVVVLHDWSEDHTNYDPSLHYLDGVAFTYAFMDARGYGGSKFMAAEFIAEEMSGDAIGLADKLGWDKFHIMGHSMAGMVVQLVATKIPDRVKSVVAVTPASSSFVGGVCPSSMEPGAAVKTDFSDGKRQFAISTGSRLIFRLRSRLPNVKKLRLATRGARGFPVPELHRISHVATGSAGIARQPLDHQLGNSEGSWLTDSILQSNDQLPATVLSIRARRRAEAYRLSSFARDEHLGTGDGNLVVNTTAFPTRSPANPGFVHLNMVLGLSTDPVLVGPHHARAELVENLKGRLVARKTKLPLKLHGGHAGRLTGDQISGPEPDVQRSVATLHHCSHRQPGVLAALAAAQDARAVFKVERLSRRAAVRAGKAVSPAGLLQVGGAGRIIGEKSATSRRRCRRPTRAEPVYV